MTGGRIILLVVGIILLLVALGLVISGGGILWANNCLTDDEGYYSTKTITVERDSYGITSTPVDIDIGLACIWDWGNLATIKIKGSSNDDSKNIFIGVAEETYLKEYLDNVEYDEVTDINIYPNELEYIRHTGNSEPEAPVSQTFWNKSAHGTGKQLLEWDIEPGKWSLVIMNEDGSPSIDADIVLGAKVPWLSTVGIWLLSIGGFVLIIGLVLIVLSIRSSRQE